MRRSYSWLRSPYRDSSNSFCNVNDDGSADWNNADCYYALPFGFCILVSYSNSNLSELSTYKRGA